MIREVEYKGTTIKYDLQRKKVKNVNLRIKHDLTVQVSASPRVGVGFIDGFVKSKGGYILKALNSLKENSTFNLSPRYTPDEFVAYVRQTFEQVYGLFKASNITRPTLELKNMRSRWGSCNKARGIISLSNYLIYCTKEQIYYVVVHEFSHLLVQNHSEDFYKIVVKYCPDYKRIRSEMNKIYI